MRWTLLWAAGAACLMLAGCDGRTDAPTDATVTTQTTTPSDQAPQAPLTELPRITASGVRALIDEAATNDQVVVVDMWATWCVPCIEMFPDLHAGVKALGDGVRMVSVTIDEPDAEPRAIEFLESQHALDDAYMALPEMDARLALPVELGERWDNLVVPAILVFDSRGRLAGEFLDGAGDVPAIIDLVAELRTAEISQASTDHSHE